MSSEQRTVIHSDNAPKAIGPYSQAIRLGNLLFCSGQAGLDPQSMKLVEGGIEPETRQTLTNLANVLETGGASLADVVKVSVFLQDMADFPKMNAIYATFFPDQPPARTTIQAPRLPLGAVVEIDAIAVVGQGS